MSDVVTSTDPEPPAVREPETTETVAADAEEPAESVPPAVRKAFGSEKARPRIVMTYIANWSFPKPKPHQVLTTARALRLRMHGVTEVKLAWGWRRLRMTLTAGYRSIWGPRQPPTRPR